MINKNIIVTGANCGIGYETALELAKRGARVIIACRDETKANQACDKIKQESKNDKVEVELLDLSKLKSIKAFSERIIAKLDRLDVLINNAGIKMNLKNLSIFSSILFFEKD
jgi:retinol dehydrogenase-11